MSSRTQASPTAFSGTAVTNLAFSPKIERDTDTLASPPPNVASKLGVWNNLVLSGLLRRSMTSPNVTYLFVIKSSDFLFVILL